MATLSKIGAQPARDRQRWASELFALLSSEVRDETLASDVDDWVALSTVQRKEWTNLTPYCELMHLGSGCHPAASAPEPVPVELPPQQQS